MGKYVQTSPPLETLPLEKELLLLAFSITNFDNYQKLREIWRKNRDDRGILGRNEQETQEFQNADMGGAIVLVDPDDLRHGLQDEIAVTTPMGLYYDEERKTLYTGSDHWIFAVKNRKVIKTLNHNLFNCIHSVTKSENSNLLVVSTGIDAILEINPDDPQRILYSWLATENGYPLSANGYERVIDREMNHQGIEYHTLSHTTHVNTACCGEKSKILATFFHQGELVEIDMATGKVSTLLNGLSNPHGIRKASFGYLVSDTRGNKVLTLRPDFSVSSFISANFNWVQDALELNNGYIAIADANNGRLVITDTLGNILQEYIYGANNKRISAMLTVKVKDAINIFGSYFSST